MRPASETKTIMKVLIPMKLVIDYNIQARVKSDLRRAEPTNAKVAINLFRQITDYGMDAACKAAASDLTKALG